MPTKVQDFLETFVFASVHEDGTYQTAQGRVAVGDLVRRCIEMASGEGLSQSQIEAEVGDLADYFRTVIDRKNEKEGKRLAADNKADHDAKSS